MQLRAFLRQVVGVGAASIAERMAALLLGILLARWLGVEDYGVYAFVMASVSLLLIGVKLGLPELIMRDIAASRANGGDVSAHSVSLNTARSLIFPASLAISAIVALIVYFTITDQRLVHAFWVGLLLLPLLSLLDLHAYALRGLGKAVLAQYAAILLPSILVLLLIALLFFWSEADPALALGSRIIAVFITLAVTVRLLGGKVSDRTRTRVASPTKARALLLQSLPFLLIGGVGVIMTRSDVIMLGILLDPQEVGIYNAAAQAAMLVGLVRDISNTIAAPEFSRLYAGGDKAALEKFAVSTARFVLIVAVPLVIILVLFAGRMLGALFGADFAEGGPVLTILALGIGLSLFWGEPGFLLNMSGNERVVFRLYAIMAIMNIVLNFALIPLMGAPGAALATVTVINVQRVLGWWLTKKIVGVSTNVLCL